MEDELLAKNRLWYIMKFNSSRLKEFGYNIGSEKPFTPQKARQLGELIALADNQFLRSIRDINNTSEMSIEEIDKLYKQRNELKLNDDSQNSIHKAREFQKKIDDALFISEYITIIMDHPSHYKHLFENGMILNNKKFVRFSCSASQARVSTVVFCEESMAKKLKQRLNNGRDMEMKLTPSKFNAYFGVSGSATNVVSTPRFCVVPDYEKEMSFEANHVAETGWQEDDIITKKTVSDKFNRFDGQGLISYEQSKKWAEELGLDYVPAQWCIRQNFVKGMLTTFRIQDFCEEVNNKNYNIKTSYKDSNGLNKIVDLRNIDVILSESQFKLWDSFESIEAYQENCKKNKLHWGVAIHTPKIDNDILKMNYQFIQALNLNDDDIEEMCSIFVEWIEKINYKDIYYTLLFLLGRNNTEEKITSYLKHSDNYWVKSLISDHKLIEDKYIKNKIYNLIKKRIQRGCLGEILVDGNFQVIVSDPYAMMQHVCGLEVTGLLKKNEYYSSYWNKKGVKSVNSMRSPLTYRSEHVILNLVNNNEVCKWYKDSYTGIIVNAFGVETVHWGGSDFDYDIIATTSNHSIVKSVFKDELPVVYSPPKPDKIVFTDQDLYNADLFAFGSIIGSITNKSTSGYALLPLFEENSDEFKTIINRLRMCTKLQSAQIDKAKIGRNVKGIPDHWVNYQPIKPEDSEEDVQEKNFTNSLLLDKHPYFFKYLYKDTKRKYNKYVNGVRLSAVQKFGVELETLLSKQRKNSEEREFIKNYYEYLPVIDTDCVMNKLCKHIESIDFNIKDKIKKSDDPNLYKRYVGKDFVFDKKTYAKIKRRVSKFVSSMSSSINLNSFESNSNKFNGELGIKLASQYLNFKESLSGVCGDEETLVNYLIELFYNDCVSYNKDLLWNSYGDKIFLNVLSNNDTPILFPFPDDNGDIEYLGYCYSVKEVNLSN